MPDETISVPTLDDDTLNALAKELGIADDDEGDEPKGEGTPDLVGRKADDGGEQASPDSGGLEVPKPPTGQALVDLLRDDPDAQKVIQQGLDKWLTDAAASAAAKEEQEEFQKLIQSGDFEAIGKKYVEGLSEKAIRERVEVDVYGQVYQALFKQPELLDTNLTAEDKVRIDHTQYDSDDEYIRVLTDFIAEKRAGVSVDERVNKTLNERIETLKNMKTQEVVSNPSVSGLPAGAPHDRGSEKRTSSSLIADGWRSAIEESAERVGEPVS
jgi:hypothetical protein